MPGVSIKNPVSLPAKVRLVSDSYFPNPYQIIEFALGLNDREEYRLRDIDARVEDETESMQEKVDTLEAEIEALQARKAEIEMELMQGEKWEKNLAFRT